MATIHASEILPSTGAVHLPPPVPEPERRQVQDYAIIIFQFITVNYLWIKLIHLLVLLHFPMLNPNRFQHVLLPIWHMVSPKQHEVF